jgi:hypothetical protein
VIAATKESPEKEDEVLQTRVRALEEDLKRRIEGLEKIRIA